MKRNILLGVVVVCGLVGAVIAVESENTPLPDHVVLQFDGYCDGMDLTRDHKHISGVQTGCASNPVEGRVRKVKHSHPREKFLLVQVLETESDIEYEIFLDGTWVVFVDGEQVNEGTWSEVPAAAPANGDLPCTVCGE